MSMTRVRRLLASFLPLVAAFAMGCEEDKPGTLIINASDGGAGSGGENATNSGASGGNVGETSGDSQGAPAKPGVCNARVVRTREDLALLEGCRVLQGTLSLIEVGRITDLSVLHDLEVIEGGLRVEGCKDLASFDGLEKLTSVAGLRIKYNPALTSVRALDTLSKVDYDIVIDTNAALEEVALNRMTGALKGPLLVRANPSFGGTFMAKLSGAYSVFIDQSGIKSMLAEIKDVETDLTVNSDSIVGFRKLETVGGEVSASGDAAVDGFDRLTLVSGKLSVSSGGAIKGLGALQAVGGDVRVYSSNAMSLPELVTVGGNMLLGTSSSSLAPDADLDKLQSVGGTLSVPDGSIEPGQLPALTAVGSLDAQNVSGLDTLTTLGGSLTVGGTVSGLNNIVQVPGSVRVGGDVTGLTRLSSVDGSFTLGGSTSSVAGLAALTTIGEALVIHDTYLADLTGLRAVETIGGDLRVTNNTFLESLSGMSALISLGGNFYEFDNPRAAACSKETLLAHSCP